MKYLFIFTLLFIFFELTGQRVTLSGFVYDKASKEPLSGATLRIRNEKTHTITNNFGFFSLTIPQTDSVWMDFQYAGYQTFSLRVGGVTNTRMEVQLELAMAIQAVEINGKQRNMSGPTPGRLDIDPLVVKELPTLFGEPDLLKGLQLLPGITPGNEGTSNLYVRGGSPDQNLILLDDAPLYYVSHVGGFVSIFDLNAIQRITLWKGGYPARYGGRLSSILDIRLKEGSKQKRKVSMDMGLLTSKIYLEIPLRKDKSSLQLSARRSLMDLLYKGVQVAIRSPNRDGYALYDVNAKYSYILNNKNRLYASYYQGGDNISSTIKDLNQNTEFTYRNKAKITWGNQLGVVRWHHIPREKWSVNTTAYISRFNYETLFTSEKLERKRLSAIKTEKNQFISRLRDLSVKTDVEYYHADQITFRFGGGLTWNKFTPFVQSVKADFDSGSIDTSFSDQKMYGFEKFVYAETEWQPIDKFQVNMGLRGSQYTTANDRWGGLQPRLSMRYDVTPKLSFNASVTRMQQYIHLLSNSGTGLPTDFWVPATTKALPESAWQTSAGLHWSLLQGWAVTMDAYYKKMSNLIEYKEGVSLFTGNPDWQDKIESGGIGIAKGLEILVEKTEGRLTGWVGYTLSSNDRRFLSLNDNRFFPYRYDRPHNFSIVSNIKLTKKRYFSFSWVYYTGTALRWPLPKGRFFPTILAATNAHSCLAMICMRYTCMASGTAIGCPTITV